MNKNLIIFFISIITALFLVSGGYGYWHDELHIGGSIEVLERESDKGGDQSDNTTEQTDDSNVLEDKSGSLEEQQNSAKSLNQTSDDSKGDVGKTKKDSQSNGEDDSSQ